MYQEKISVVDGVALYGGFTGTETARSQRNWAKNATVIDGGGSEPVVSVLSGAINATVIDGFTIRNGYAYSGAGVLCASASPVIRNNRLTGNTAVMDAGAIACSYGVPVIENCLIDNNTARRGAGLYFYQSQPRISNVTVASNTATTGGVLYLSSSTPTMSNSIIAFNVSGIYAQNSTTTMDHCCVFGNTGCDSLRNAGCDRIVRQHISRPALR